MIRAEVICDSVSPAGIRLSSVQIVAHRFILAEINTHRLLSRSYRSSRAVPSARLIEEVRINPAMPVYWGANEKGMQASAELDNVKLQHNWSDADYTDRGLARMFWQEAARYAADAAEKMAKHGLHKQIANRVLEPFLWAHGIITATEWDNFFGLRLHKAAQPEFRALANEIWTALKASEPRSCAPEANWHLPYFQPEDWTAIADYAERTDQYERYMMDLGIHSGSWAKDLAIKMSVARCARSSYHSFETGKRPTVEEDLATYAKLNIPGTEHYDPTQPIHASPAEHQGTPDVWQENTWDEYPQETNKFCWANPREHGNFAGWRQYRKMLPGEAVAPLPEGYR